MDFEIAYFTLSIGVAILAIISVFVARMAINRGLSHSAMAASVWALIFFAIARTWHTFRELIEMSELGEMFEYILYIIAFVLFITLAMRSNKTPTSDQIRKSTAYTGKKEE